MLVYNEHTWGAWNSISDPDAEFVRTQAAWKSARAENADQQSKALVAQALGGFAASEERTIAVFNTTSRSRTDLVLLSPELSRAGDRVQDADGRTLPSQRLASGELAFLAREVPPLGASSFTLSSETALSEGTARIDGNKLQTDRLSLEIDLDSGALSSLRLQGLEEDLVDTRRHTGLNDYIYVEGRDAHDQRRVKAP